MTSRGSNLDTPGLLVLSASLLSLPKPKVAPLGYPRSQVPALVGLSRRQVTYLAERELVVPSVRGSSGRGSATLYSWENLLVMATLSKLLEATRSGLGAAQAGPIAQALVGVGERPLKGRFLICDPSDCFIVDSASAAANLVERSPALITVDLERVEDSLSRELLRSGIGGEPPTDRQRAA